MTQLVIEYSLAAILASVAVFCVGAIVVMGVMALKELFQ